MTKSVWLSFADDKTGENLGVAVVRVTDDELRAEKAELAVTHPNAHDDAGIVSAAARKAWRLGWNPGGEVLSYVLPPGVYDGPLDRLLTDEEIARYGEPNTQTGGDCMCALCQEERDE